MGIFTLIGMIVVILWVLGFVGHVGGGLIHALIVIALILFIIDLIKRNRLLR